MNKLYLEEAAIVDFSDDELKAMLGAVYHRIRDLADEKRNDPVLTDLRDKIQEHCELHYVDAERSLNARMKAGRALAAARGLKWKIPSEE